MSERQGEPRTLVLDTSVAIKWYLTEELTDEAVRLLDSARDSVSELLAPGTLQPEFFNALWQRHRRGELEREEVRRVWREFVTEDPASLYAPEDLMPRAAEIALSSGVIVYDALFLALAEDAETVVVTADGRLIRNLEGTAYGRLAHALENVAALL